MNSVEFQKLKQIVAVLEMGFNNCAAFDVEPNINIDVNYGKSKAVVITDSMKSTIHATVIQHNREMIDSCISELRLLVSKID